jgi:hypothetical protein
MEPVRSYLNNNASLQCSRYSHTAAEIHKARSCPTYIQILNPTSTECSMLVMGSLLGDVRKSIRQARARAPRRPFDPNVYRIVLFDQRGSGRSTPHASEPNIDLSTGPWVWGAFAVSSRCRQHPCRGSRWRSALSASGRRTIVGVVARDHSALDASDVHLGAFPAKSFWRTARSVVGIRQAKFWQTYAVALPFSNG